MHGGRIWVESKGIEGEGSKFSFTLPLMPTQFEADEVDGERAWQRS
jgi:signal transduction histidine kinase